MAIQQSKKQSDLEKRLKLLHLQVYGKNSEILKHRYTDTPTSSDLIRPDITYLRHDLIKILTLSSLAIGAQLILFFLKGGE